MSEVLIRDAEGEADIAVIRTMFSEHARLVGLDNTFAGMDAELAQLPGVYAPPRGALLVARRPDGTPLGGAALRPLPGPGDAEWRGIYLTPEARGQGVGKVLAQELLARALAAGYRRLWVDSYDRFPIAIALYEAYGFVRTTPYFPNSPPGTFWMVRDLDPGA